MKNQKDNVKKITKIFCEILIFATAISHTLLGMDFVLTSLTMIGSLLIYAIISLWADDFFKKNWKKRNYRPWLIIILALIALYKLHDLAELLKTIEIPYD